MSRLIQIHIKICFHSENDGANSVSCANEECISPIITCHFSVRRYIVLSLLMVSSHGFDAGCIR